MLLAHVNKSSLNNLRHRPGSFAQRLRTSCKLNSWLARLPFFGYPDWIDRIQTQTTRCERLGLFKLARLLPNGAQVIEIGSFVGASTCCLAAGAQGRGITVHAVDTHEMTRVGGTPSGQERNTLAEFQNNITPYADSIQLHIGRSTDRVSDFSEQVHMLFIDAGHNWESVVADLNAYMPLLQDQGIIAMHDVGFSKACAKALHDHVLPLETERLVNLNNLYAGRVMATRFKQIVYDGHDFT